MNLIIGIILTPLILAFFVVFVGTTLTFALPSTIGDNINLWFETAFFIADFPVIRVFFEFYTTVLFPMVLGLLAIRIAIIV